MYINLRNKAGTFEAQGATHERGGDLQLVPGVTLKLGDNLIDLAWFEKLPAGYHDQVNEWIKSGWIERLPVEKRVSP
jgi:hypothetical protein